MKSNKISLYIQTLTILPLLLFLLIYVEYTLLSSSVILILFSLLSSNLYRYTKKLHIIQYPVLAILVLSFLVYGYNKLGSLEAPQQYEVMHQKAFPSATFNFSKIQNIDEICFFTGINKNVEFTLENLENGEYKIFYKYENKFPYSFQWSCIDKDITTSQIRLKITKNQMMLSEVHFLSNKQSIKYTTNKQKLNDEQNISIDTTYYGGTFFDEIYHSRTAYEIMRGIDVYENTHPYLGKILIIPGIKLFGMTPFGWRFTNVLFASLLIIVAYYFSLQLFRKRLYAFSTAFLMTYSFMHLTQARIGLIDTFGVLFVFISYYFLYRFILKQKLSLLLTSGVFFGLASAVKWSAVFASLGFVLIALYLLITKYPLEKRFSGYRLILYGLLSYVAISILIYTLSFWDIYLQTGSFQKILDYQINMFNYHSSVASNHSYSSPWWSWPINFKPMCYYRETNNQLFSSITVFGNPAIFWIGTVSILYLFYVLVKRKTLEASFILLAYLGLYLPYVFVGRQMFIYHYYYTVPLIILSIIYMFKDSIKYFPQYKDYYFLYLSIIAILFLAFYPVLSGYEVPKTYVDYVLRWFPGWWF